MGGDDDSLIPSVFIGHSSAMMLINHFMYVDHPDFRLILTDDDPFDINTYLLPFAIGTIHILRKQFYSTKISLTYKFFTKTVFFRQIKRISFSTLHFDEIFML